MHIPISHSKFLLSYRLKNIAFNNTYRLYCIEFFLYRNKNNSTFIGVNYYTYSNLGI